MDNLIIGLGILIIAFGLFTIATELHLIKEAILKKETSEK